MKKSIILEILIVVFVIGIATVLIYPKMIKNLSKQILSAQLKQAYNVASTAVSLYLEDSGKKTLYDTDVFNKNLSVYPTALEKFVKTSFFVSKICTSKTEGGIDACLGSEYKSMKGEKTEKLKGEVCAILTSDATLCFNRIPSRKSVSRLYIDVNGPKEPNVWGRDAYMLEFSQTGELAESFSKDAELTSPEHCGKDPYASGCFYSVQEAGWIMKY